MALVEVPFEVVISRDLEAVVVTIRGELDTYTAPQLRSHLTDLIEEQGKLPVVADLSEMTFVDSSGLAVLVDALKRVRNRGGTLRLDSPTKNTSKVLEISGLDRVFADSLV